MDVPSALQVLIASVMGLEDAKDRNHYGGSKEALLKLKDIQDKCRNVVGDGDHQYRVVSLPLTDAPKAKVSHASPLTPLSTALLHFLPLPPPPCHTPTALGAWAVPPPPLAHARPCLSTGWVLNRRFEEILGPLFSWSRKEGL